MELEVVPAVPSLDKLLKHDWGLDKTVKKGLMSLQAELMSMHAFLADVSSMPPDQIESYVKLMAHEVRELSHYIETCLHSFVARMESTKGTLLPAVIINHEMVSYIKETQIKVKEVRQRYGPYPCKSSLERVTTRRAVDELTEKLSEGDHVSIVGMGGMGKTTLARAVYDKIKGDFDCGAFVPIGQRADVEEVLKAIFDALHMEIYGKEPGPRQLISQLQSFLVHKRWLFVIDDVWDEGTWNLVKRVLMGRAGSKIITTTRNVKVAEEVGGIYPIKPLSLHNSKELLRTKAEAKRCDTEFDIVATKIFLKCGGVPKAITMIGSFLAKNKSKGWSEAYNSIGFDEHKEDGVFKHINTVFADSYYDSYCDLPYIIKKCFLYLSLFPENHWIEKNMLIWRWIAEGLVPDEIFETGETYFNELLDKSMIEWAVSPRDLSQGGCRVHTLMLDHIRFLSSSEEDNFSTVLGMKQESTPQTGHIRRLAIHDTMVGQSQNTRLEVREVLSLYASMCPGSSLPPLPELANLRAIDLESCDLSVGDCKLEQLCRLEGLKYIGLVGTPIAELPRETGDIKLVQTLDVTATGIRELPPFVAELRKLRCLRAGKGTRMMGRVGELTSLEELWLHSADKSLGFAAEVRKLTKVVVASIV